MRSARVENRSRALTTLLLPLVCALAASAGSLAPQGTEFQVNTYALSGQLDQRVARSGNDGFVVVWESWLQDGDDYGIFGQRFDADGLPVGGEFQVNVTAVDAQASPAVAADDLGGFFVAWYGGEAASSFDVFGRRYDANGVPLGSEFQINSYAASWQRHPDVSTDGAGGFVVVWQSVGQDGDLQGIFGQRFDANGTPVGSEFQVNTTTADKQMHPRLTSLPGGGFVVVWASRGQDGDGFGIYGQRYDASGTPLGAEFQVNSYTPGDQHFPAVAADEGGGFVVVWDSNQDGDGFGIYGQRFDASGAAVGAEFRVNGVIAGDQTQATVASDPSSGFLVVWQSGYPDASGSDVFARRLGTDGALLGAEFRVNAPAGHFRGLPNVAANGGGGFVVVWQSDQDGDGDGVFARSYVRVPTHCCDGLDNDGDGRIDFDGGAAAGLPPQQQTLPDPQCGGDPTRNREWRTACGLGPEIALLGAPFAWMLRRRRRTRRAVVGRQVAT